MVYGSLSGGLSGGVLWLVVLDGVVLVVVVHGSGVGVKDVVFLQFCVVVVGSWRLLEVW